jgi:putative transposase
VAERKLHLDCYSRKVVGWAFAERADAELVMAAVRMAMHNRCPEPGVIHHSDQGTQYTSLRFGKQLETSAIFGSMGSVGSAGDNAVMESFFATLQTELLDRHRWFSRAQLQSAIFEFVEVFYNRQRRHSYLGYLCPVEFERRSQFGTGSAKLETVH